MLEAGASLEARDRFGAKPLSHAAAAGQIEIVALFLDHGAPIDARDLDGSTALFKAAETGRLTIVKLLVEHGADVDLPGRSGVTPLSAAAFMGSAPIVAFLIEKGADPKCDRRHAESRRSSMPWAAAFPPSCTRAAGSWRRRQRQIRQRPHRADVGRRLFGEAGVKDAVDVMTLLLDRGAVSTIRTIAAERR